MKKFRLCTGLALVMMFVMCVGAFADPETVSDYNAFIGKFTNGGEVNVKLGTDITLTSSLKIGNPEKVTIDLGGHKINAVDMYAIWVKSGDVTITGQGTIEVTHNNNEKFKNTNAVIWLGDDSDKNTPNSTKAKLTIDENVTVSTDYCYGIAVMGYNKTGNDGAEDDIELVVNGTVSVTGEASAISGNGTNTLSPTKMTVKGKATSEKDYAIYHPGKGTLTIEGTIKGKGGIEAKAGTVNIEESAIIQATGTGTHTPYNNGTSTSGYVIASLFNKNYTGPAEVNIKGGTISGDLATLHDNNEGDSDEEKKKVGKIIISGGVFTADPTAYLSAEENTKAVAVGITDETYKYAVFVPGDTTITGDTTTTTTTTDNKTTISKDYDGKGITLTANTTITKPEGGIEVGETEYMPDYKYQWYSNDVAIEGATKVSYDTKADVHSAMYKVIVSLDVYKAAEESGEGGGDEQTNTAIPTEIGSAEVTVSIISVNSAVATAPTAITGITTASPDTQPLVNAGEATNGTMNYGIGATEPTTWSTAIPTLASTDKKAQTVSVWYKVVGNANYNDTAAAKVEVTISEAPAAPSDPETPETPETPSENDTPSNDTPVTPVTPQLLKSADLPVGTVGTVYNADLTKYFKASPDATGYTWSISGNPSWLVLSTDKKTISGNPTVDGTVSFDVKISITGTTVSGDATLRAVLSIDKASGGGNSDEKTDEEKKAEEIAQKAEQAQEALEQAAETGMSATDLIANIESIAAQSEEQLAEITTIPPITGQVNSADLKTILTQLVNLVALDLSKVETTEIVIPETASNTALQEVNLEGNTTVEKVEIKNNTSVTKLNLKGTTSLKTVDATGCESLEEVDVAGNTAIEELTLDSTNVASLNVAGCAGLTNLNASDCAGLENIDLTGCMSLDTVVLNNTAIKSLDLKDCTELKELSLENNDETTAGSLEELDVSNNPNLESLSVGGNKLAWLDFSNNPKMTRGNFNGAGQRRSGGSDLKLTRNISLLDLFFTFLGWTTEEEQAQEQPFDLSKVARIVTVSGDQEIEADGYDEETGEATFSATPENLKYYYDPFASDENENTTNENAFYTADPLVVADDSDDEGLMDVSVTDGEQGDDETLTSNGGGCETGLGALSAAVLLFAALKKKIS